MHTRAVGRDRVYDITYKDGDVELRVPRDRIVFLARPDAVSEEEHDMSPSQHALSMSQWSVLTTGDGLLDPEMGELLDFTQDVCVIAL